MVDLRKVFARYTGGLRDYKLLYMANNVLHAKQLGKNKSLYRKYGVKKSVFAPISSLNIPDSGEKPWLDRPEVYNNLEQDSIYQNLDEQRKTYVQQWCEQGFLILKGFVDKDTLAAVNEEMASLKAAGKLKVNYTGVKIMDAFHKSPKVRAIAESPELKAIMQVLLQKEMVPFQTINFEKGSQQRMHSDFVHMTTEPKGYLTGAWLALEDIDADNGPLEYIPGSHRLPYILLGDFKSGNSKWKLGPYAYKAYEDRISQLMEAQQLETVQLKADAGDLLLWHANLLHSGAAIKDSSRTRKSMVTHYFAKDVLCYHEITERPAIF